MTFINYGYTDKDEPEYTSEVFNLYDLVESLIFKGDQMEDLLIECESQFRDYLAIGLISMATLRKKGLVHFVSVQAEIYT